MDFDPDSPFVPRRVSPRISFANLKLTSLKFNGAMQVGLAAAICAVVFALLFLMGHAPNAKARLAHMDEQVARSQKAHAATGDLNAFPVGSACQGALPDVFRSQLDRSVSATGLQVVSLDIGDAASVDKSGLTAYAVRIVARGPYESAVSALAALDKARPVIFVDSLSLKNKTSVVDLAVEGRVFCRTQNFN